MNILGTIFVIIEFIFLSLLCSLPGFLMIDDFLFGKKEEKEEK
jgi:hypothetical protein